MVTLADLGILRDVAAEGEQLVVTITPTYSGCPALREIAHDLRYRLTQAGFADVTVRTALAPAWSSDWITAEGRRKLHAAGIAPPQAAGAPAHHPEPRPAYPHRDPPRAGPLPAVWLARHHADRGVQRDRLQGAVPLRGLPRALRIREGHLMPPPGPRRGPISTRSPSRVSTLSPMTLPR